MATTRKTNTPANKTTLTETKFWQALAEAQKVKTLTADLFGWALKAVAAGDNQPAEALISVFGNKAKHAMREAGLGHFFSVTNREKPHEYKGVTITVALKLKEAAKPFIDVLPARILPYAEQPEALLASLDAKEKEAKAEAKAKAEAEKATAEYWQKRLEKLAKEAEAHGVKIEFKIQADAVAPAKAVEKSPTAKGRQTTRK